MSKLRRTTSSTGRPGKALRKLWGRQADWEQMTQGKSDIARKHPKGLRKPGRGY